MTRSDSTDHMLKRRKVVARRFTHASGLMPHYLKKASEKRGFVMTRLLTEWDQIVGADIANMARPEKVSFAKDGFGATLLVTCNGANAPMVQMQIPLIRERVNACYGYNAISHVRITQTTRYSGSAQPSGMAAPQTPFQHRKGLPAEHSQALRKDVSTVGDESLQKALLSLGENISLAKRTNSD